MLQSSWCDGVLTYGQLQPSNVSVVCKQFTAVPLLEEIVKCGDVMRYLLNVVIVVVIVVFGFVIVVVVVAVIVVAVVVVVVVDEILTTSAGTLGHVLSGAKQYERDISCTTVYFATSKQASKQASSKQASVVVVIVVILSVVIFVVVIVVSDR
jgi:hypothetical protein